jgi:hypothetical protein
LNTLPHRPSRSGGPNLHSNDRVHPFNLNNSPVVLKFAGEIPANKDIIESNAISINRIDTICDADYFATLSYLL